MRVELPTLDRITRIVKAAIHKNENQFFQEVFKKLSKDTILKIDSLINNLISSEKKEVNCETEITFTELRADPGRTSLDSILREISKLKSIKNLELPEDLFKKISNKIRLALVGERRSVNYKDVLSYSDSQLKSHLEKQFKDGMSWDNYGVWHIDHKIPVSAFN